MHSRRFLSVVCCATMLASCREADSSLQKPSTSQDPDKPNANGTIHKLTALESKGRLIELDSAFLIGGDNANNTPTPFTRDVRMTKWGIVLGENYSGVPVLMRNDSVFDFGRKGEGPGEISTVDAVSVGSEGNMYVLDSRRTLTTFQVNGKLRGSIALENVSLVIASTNDRLFAVRGSSRTPIHHFALFNGSGRLLIEFGPLEPLPLAGMYVIASTPIGGLVAVNKHAYKLVYYAKDGDSLGAIVRSDVASWFAQRTRRCQGRSTQAFPTSIGDVHVSASGRTWVMLNHINLNKCVAPATAGAPLDPQQKDQVVDTRIDVYEKGELIGTRLWDESLGGFADDNHVWRLVELQNGGLAIQIWRLRV